MKRFLLAAAFAAAATCGIAAPARAQQHQCWLDSLSDAEKRALVLGYAREQQAEGKAAADAWAQEQRAAYTRRAIDQGTCSADGAAKQPKPAPAPDKEQVLNRYGQPCRRLELENQNVPNLGGAMGWALVQVCKD